MATTSSSAQLVHKTKVIFDTDPGVDDIIALLLLLASDEAELALISVVFGNTELKYAYKNVLKTYQILAKHLSQYPEDRARFPGLGLQPTLCYGSDGPLAGELQLAEYFHGPDGLSDVSTTHPEFDVHESGSEPSPFKESNTLAEDAIIELLLREPDDSVIIIAVGPLTNIARAWLKEPRAIAKARRIFVMGGALDVPGNTSAAAEFNFFADPTAATIMMDAAKCEDINLVLAPLDVTSLHNIPFSCLIHPLLLSGPLLNGPELSGAMTPVRAFTSAFLYRVRGIMRDLGEPDSLQMHDPTTVWAALAHADIPRDASLLPEWKTIKRNFVIERTGEYTKGMCVVDRRGGTDKIGAVRSVDGIATSTKLKNDIVGVNVLYTSPGAAVLEEVIAKKLFWDL